jgi:hypothetical protein
VFFVLFPGSFSEDSFYGRAYWFISAMNAADPTTRTMFSFTKLDSSSFDAVRACFWFSSIFNPTNPFVAGEGSDSFPNSECFGGGGERCL